MPLAKGISRQTIWPLTDLEEAREENQRQL